MRETTVIHIKDTPSDWKRRPGEYVYIGRGGRGGNPWGNPFRIGDPHPASGRPMDRDDVCNLFEERVLPRLIKNGEMRYLQGRILVCFCHPQRCHGHALAAAANKE